MATTADIKNGMCIELDGKTFSIVEFLHVKPGKGPAFVRTKLKNLENGRILDKTFSAGERIEPVRVERRPYQFTYEDDMGAHFIALSMVISSKVSVCMKCAPMSSS